MIKPIPLDSKRGWVKALIDINARIRGPSTRLFFSNSYLLDITCSLLNDFSISFYVLGGYKEHTFEIYITQLPDSIQALNEYDSSVLYSQGYATGLLDNKGKIRLSSLHDSKHWIELTSSRLYPLENINNSFYTPVTKGHIYTIRKDPPLYKWRLYKLQSIVHIYEDLPLQNTSFIDSLYHLVSQLDYRPFG